MNHPNPAVTSEEFDRLIDGLGAPNGQIAIAVSGGADSMALARLAIDWAKRHQVQVTVLTVDHGLRPASAAEAKQVTGWMADLGVAHTVLTWTGAKPQTGIQAAARDARYALMGGCCRDNGVGTLLVGHHRDDQAETYLMRLDRGSGPNGLAGMSAITDRYGVRIARPLLGVPKSRLVATCRGLGQGWIEDPSNCDPRYARTRARATLAADNDGAAIAALTHSYGLARATREREIGDLLAATAKETSLGFVRLDWRRLAAATQDVGTGALSRVLCRISGAIHGPRTAALQALHRAVARELTATRSLHRCLVIPHADGQVTVCREPRNLPIVPIKARDKLVWDRRFLVALAHGDNGAAMTVGPLGPLGWRQIREQVTALPSTVTTALPPAVPTQICYGIPALFHLDRVISVPSLGLTGELGGFAAQFSPALPLIPRPFAVVSSRETPIFRETKSAQGLESLVVAEPSAQSGSFANG
jgi:tRNA(Ile)-lysidine synthase